MPWLNDAHIRIRLLKRSKSVTHWEGFDGPLHSTLLRYPLGMACAGLKFGWVSVARHGHQDNHIVGSGAAFKLATGLQDTVHHTEVNLQQPEYH